MSKPVQPHPQFVDMEQQRETAEIGMWVFLITEVMFFGGLFTAYTYYRHLYPAGFMEASRHGDFWLGTTNTVVLLISSFTMVLAVNAARNGQRRAIVLFLSLTWILGATFLAVKGVEYAHHIHEHLWPGPSFSFPGPHAREVEMFFYLYFAMTGVHALHMIIGLGVVGVLTVWAYQGRFSEAYHTPVEITGLYWHFVDIIWIFLFPLLYLIGQR